MKDLTRGFEQTINGEERTLYEEIRDSLVSELGRDNVDIEAVFTVIEGLKHYNEDSLGTLALYATKKLCQKSLKELKDKLPTHTLISNLERAYQKFIREKCRVPAQNRQRLNEVYANFFTGAESITPQNYKTLGTKIPCDPMWTFFTTNYDRCLEAFWREHAGATLYTGFQPRGSRFILNPESLFVHDANNPVLIKLHGSTTWLRNRTTGEIEEKDYDLEHAQMIGTVGYDEDVAIFPLSQKALYFEPYLELFYVLNKTLQRTKAWIVIGYSFRDPIIRDIFVAQSKGKKLILVHPDAAAIYHKLNIAGTKILATKFGDDNYRGVNAEIWRLVQE